MDLHRLRVVEFDSLISEKEGEKTNIAELGESKQEDCKTLSSDDNDNETNLKLETDKIFLRGNESPPESSKISSFIKYKSNSEIFDISPKDKLRQSELKINTTVADVKKTFQESVQNQKKRTFNLFKKKTRNEGAFTEKPVGRKKKEEVHFLFARDTPSFIRYSRKRAKNKRTNDQDSKVLNDVFGFQENRSVAPHLYQTSCNYWNLDKMSIKKIKKGFCRKPKPVIKPVRDCFCKHHAMRVLTSAVTGSGKRNERPAIYYNLSIHSCPRKKRLQRNNSLYEEVWAREQPIFMAKDKNVEVSPSSLITIAKSYCNANVGPSQNELPSRSQHPPTAKHGDVLPQHRKVPYPRCNKPYPQHSTPSPSSESNGPEQYQPQVVPCKRKRTNAKKMFSIINSQRTKLFSGFFQRINAFHIKNNASRQKCIKYAFFGLLIVVWSPCLLAVILAWAVMCPVRLTNVLNTNKTKSLFPVLSSFVNKFRKKTPRSDYERMCFGDCSYKQKRNGRTSVANWYTRARHTVENSYNALLSMFKIRHKPPTCAGSSFLTSTHPNPNKRYTLFYADNRGWMMKPARRSNARPFPSTRVVQTMRCEFRPKFWRKAPENCKRLTCDSTNCRANKGKTAKDQMKVRSSPKLCCDCQPRGVKKRKSTPKAKAQMKTGSSQKTHESPVNGKTSCDCPASAEIACFCPAGGTVSCKCPPGTTSCKCPARGTISCKCPPGGIVSCDCPVRGAKSRTVSCKCPPGMTTACKCPARGTISCKCPQGGIVSCKCPPGGTVSCECPVHGAKGRTISCKCPPGGITNCKCPARGTKSCKCLQGGTVSCECPVRGAKGETVFCECPVHGAKGETVFCECPVHGAKNVQKNAAKLSAAGDAFPILQSIQCTCSKSSTKYIPQRKQVNILPNYFYPTSGIVFDPIVYQTAQIKPNNLNSIKISDISQNDVVKYRLGQRKNGTLPFGVVVDCGTKHPLIMNKETYGTHRFALAGKTLKMSSKCNFNCNKKFLQRQTSTKPSSKYEPSTNSKKSVNVLRTGVTEITKTVLPPKLSPRYKTNLPLGLSTKCGRAFNCHCGINHKASITDKKKFETSSRERLHTRNQSILARLSRVVLTKQAGTSTNKIIFADKTQSVSQQILSQQVMDLANSIHILRQKAIGKSKNTPKQTLHQKDILVMDQENAIQKKIATEDCIRAFDCPCKNKLSEGTESVRPGQIVPDTKIVDCRCSTQQKPNKDANNLLSKHLVSKCACKNGLEQSLADKKAIDCGCIIKNQSDIGKGSAIQTALNCPCKNEVSVGTETVSPGKIVSDKKAVDCRCSTEKNPNTAANKIPSKQPASKCACKDQTSTKKEKTRPAQSFQDKKAVDCDCKIGSQENTGKSPAIQTAFNCPCINEVSVATETVPRGKNVSDKNAVDCRCGTEKKPSTAAKQHPSKQQAFKCACKDEPIKKKEKLRPEQSLADKKAVDCDCKTVNQENAGKSPSIQTALNFPCKSEVSVATETVPPGKIVSDKKAVDCSCITEKKPRTVAKQHPSKQPATTGACKDEPSTKEEKRCPGYQSTLPDKKAVDCGCMNEIQQKMSKGPAIQTALNCPCKNELSVGTNTVCPKLIASNKKAVDCQCSTEKKPNKDANKLPSKELVSKCACKNEPITLKEKLRPEQSLLVKKAIDCGCCTEKELSTAAKEHTQSIGIDCTKNTSGHKLQSTSLEKLSLKVNVSEDHSLQYKTALCPCRDTHRPITISTKTTKMPSRSPKQLCLTNNSSTQVPKKKTVTNILRRSLLTQKVSKYTSQYGESINSREIGSPKQLLQFKTTQMDGGYETDSPSSTTTEVAEKQVILTQRGCTNVASHSKNQPSSPESTVNSGRWPRNSPTATSADNIDLLDKQRNELTTPLSSNQVTNINKQQQTQPMTNGLAKQVPSQQENGSQFGVAINCSCGNDREVVSNQEKLRQPSIQYEGTAFDCARKMQPQTATNKNNVKQKITTPDLSSSSKTPPSQISKSLSSQSVFNNNTQQQTDYNTNDSQFGVALNCSCGNKSEVGSTQDSSIRQPFNQSHETDSDHVLKRQPQIVVDTKSMKLRSPSTVNTADQTGSSDKPPSELLKHLSSQPVIKNNKQQQTEPPYVVPNRPSSQLYGIAPDCTCQTRPQIAVDINSESKKLPSFVNTDVLLEDDKTTSIDKPQSEILKSVSSQKLINGNRQNSGQQAKDSLFGVAFNCPCGNDIEIIKLQETDAQQPLTQSRGILSECPCKIKPRLAVDKKDAYTNKTDSKDKLSSQPAGPPKHESHTPQKQSNASECVREMKSPISTEHRSTNTHQTCLEEKHPSQQTKTQKIKCNKPQKQLKTSECPCEDVSQITNDNKNTYTNSYKPIKNLESSDCPCGKKSMLHTNENNLPIYTPSKQVKFTQNQPTDLEIECPCGNATEGKKNYKTQYPPSQHIKSSQTRSAHPPSTITMNGNNLPNRHAQTQASVVGISSDCVCEPTEPTKTVNKNLPSRKASLEHISKAPIHPLSQHKRASQTQSPIPQDLSSYQQSITGKNINNLCEARLEQQKKHIQVDSCKKRAIKCICRTKKDEVGENDIEIIKLQETDARQPLTQSRGILSECPCKIKPRLAVDKKDAYTNKTDSKEKLSSQPAEPPKNKSHSTQKQSKASECLCEMKSPISTEHRSTNTHQTCLEERHPSQQTKTQKIKCNKPQKQLKTSECPCEDVSQITNDNKNTYTNSYKPMKNLESSDCPCGKKSMLHTNENNLPIYTPSKQVKFTQNQPPDLEIECPCGNATEGKKIYKTQYPPSQHIKSSQTRSAHPPSTITMNGNNLPNRHAQTQASVVGISSDCVCEPNEPTKTVKKNLPSRKASLEHISKAPIHPLSQNKRASQTQSPIPQDLSDYQQSITGKNRNNLCEARLEQQNKHIQVDTKCTCKHKSSIAWCKKRAIKCICRTKKDEVGENEFHQPRPLDKALNKAGVSSSQRETHLETQSSPLKTKSEQGSSLRKRLSKCTCELKKKQPLKFNLKVISSRKSDTVVRSHSIQQASSKFFHTDCKCPPEKINASQPSYSSWKPTQSDKSRSKLFGSNKYQRTQVSFPNDTACVCSHEKLEKISSKSEKADRIVPRKTKSFKQTSNRSFDKIERSPRHTSKISGLLMKIRSKFRSSKKSQQSKLPNNAPVIAHSYSGKCPCQGGNTSSQLQFKQGESTQSFLQRLGGSSRKSKTSRTKSSRSFSHIECDCMSDSLSKSLSRGKSTRSLSRYNQSSRTSQRKSFPNNSRNSRSGTHSECCSSVKKTYSNVSPDNNSRFIVKPLSVDKSYSKSSRSSFPLCPRDKCRCQLHPKLFKVNKKQPNKTTPNSSTVMTNTPIKCTCSSCKTSSMQNREILHSLTPQYVPSQKHKISQFSSHPNRNQIKKTRHSSHILFKDSNKNNHEKISRSLDVQKTPIIPGKCACLSEKPEKLSLHSQSNSSQPPPLVANQKFNSNPVLQGPHKTKVETERLSSDKQKLSTEPLPMVETEKPLEFQQALSTPQSDLPDRDLSHRYPQSKQLPEKLGNNIISQQPSKTQMEKNAPENLPQRYPNQHNMRPYPYDLSRPIVPVIPGMCTCAAKQRQSEYLHKIHKTDEQRVLSDTVPNNSHKYKIRVEGLPEFSQHPKQSSHPSTQPSPFAEERRLQSDALSNFPRKTMVGTPLPSRSPQSQPVSQLETDPQSESNLHLCCQPKNLVEKQQLPLNQLPRSLSKYSGNLVAPPITTVEKQRLQQGSEQELPRKSHIGTGAQPELFYDPPRFESPQSPPFQDFHPTRIIPGKCTCSDNKYGNSLEVVANYIKGDTRYLPYQSHKMTNHSPQNFQQLHISRVYTNSATRVPRLPINMNNYTNIKGHSEKLLDMSQHIIVQRSELMQSPKSLQTPQLKQILTVLKRNAFESPTKELNISPEKSAPVDKQPPGLLQRRSGQVRKGEAVNGVKSSKQQPYPDFNRVKMNYPARKRSEQSPGPKRKEHIPPPAKNNYQPAVGVSPPPKNARRPCYANPANKCGPKTCFDEFALRRAYKRRPLRYTPPKQQTSKSKKELNQKKQSKKDKKKDEKNKRVRRKPESRLGCNIFRLLKEAEKEAWPIDVTCRPIYIHALKRRPCFWIFKCCPSIYPAFLGCLKLQQNVCQMCLYGLALCLWSPFLLCFYACLNLLCKCCS